MKKLAAEIRTILTRQWPASVSDAEIRRLAKRHLLTSLGLLLVGFVIFTWAGVQMAFPDSTLRTLQGSFPARWGNGQGLSREPLTVVLMVLAVIVFGPVLLGFVLLNGCLYRLCFGVPTSDDALRRIGRFIGGAVLVLLTMLVLFIIHLEVLRRMHILYP